MRRVLGVLTEASGDQAGGADQGQLAAAVPLAPQPTFDELHPLVESYRAAGLPITLSVSGSVPADSATQLTVFRVVQESLTNALRYARTPSRVEVIIDFTTSATADVTVRDDGLTAPETTAPSVGSGRGLIGMRERVALYGGTVEAGPVEPRGWRVHARISSVSPDSSPSQPRSESPLS
jgi:signal transduction histidine kinase